MTTQHANTHPCAKMDDGVPFSAWTAFCRHFHAMTAREADPRDRYHLDLFRHFAAGWKAGSGDAEAEAKQHLSPGATPSAQQREQDTGGPSPDGEMAAPGDPTASPHPLSRRMDLCPTCGNKRCPHATDPAKACTGSNEPNQAAPGETFYGFDALESPLFECLDEAVEWYAGRFNPMSPVEAFDGIAWPLVVDEFRLMPKPTAERALGWWLDGWDTDYTHESCGPTKPTPERVAAMQRLLDLLPVSNCETTGKTITVTKERAINMMGGRA